MADSFSSPTDRRSQTFALQFTWRRFFIGITGNDGDYRHGSVFADRRQGFCQYRRALDS
jgi:hypothetical protein